MQVDVYNTSNAYNILLYVYQVLLTYNNNACFMYLCNNFYTLYINSYSESYAAKNQY